MSLRQGKLRSNEEFREVLKRGRSFANDLAVLYVLRAPAGEAAAAKFGVSVPRRFGGAVDRNRVRRLFWEAHRRLEGDSAAQGRRLVIIPRHRARGSSYWDVLAALEDLRRRAGLGKKDSEA
jgi:ribonuclease P protein component